MWIIAVLINITSFIHLEMEILKILFVYKKKSPIKYLGLKTIEIFRIDIQIIMYYFKG